VLDQTPESDAPTARRACEANLELGIDVHDRVLTTPQETMTSRPTQRSRTLVFVERSDQSERGARPAALQALDLSKVRCGISGDEIGMRLQCGVC
jgi:hypothetical protein